MNHPFRGPFGAIFMSGCVCIGTIAGTLWSAPAAAQTPEPPESSAPSWLTRFQGPGHGRLVVSPYSHHFRYSDEHKYVWAIGAERQLDNGWLYGGSFFRNSFGQPSAYAYAGERYTGLLDRPPLYFQWTAGVMYGYKGKYKNKVPLNYGGFSPGAVVSLGWEFDRSNSVQFNLLGDAALMLQFSREWR